MFLKFSRKYAGFSGFNLEFLDEGYDDSFSWFGLQQFDEIVGSHLVWLDVDRLSGATTDTQLWLIGRISALSGASTKDISCFVSSKDQAKADSWCEAVEHAVPDVSVHSIWSGAEASASSVIDERIEKIGGTYVSAACQARLARDYSVRRFVTPSSAPTKLIIVDLDWTMYDGVLLEDGLMGVQLTPEHKLLWDTLKEARDSGVLLGIASKNEMQLVRDFFDSNNGIIPLGIEDFIGTEIHFGPKSESVASLISLARTTPGATVFVDDNVGELAEVASIFSDINLVVGGMYSVTRRWLRCGVAGIRWGSLDEHAAARVADIKARVERDEVARSAGPSDASSLLRQMEIKLRVKLDDQLDLPRIADMISRTNQFNSNLERKTEDELLKLAAGAGTHWVTVGLSDKFSDSGVIFAMVLGINESGKPSASNFVLSCRAMGRGLEPVIVRESLRILAQYTAKKEIVIPWVTGPRNQPALEFLKENSDGFIANRDSGDCLLSEATLKVRHQFDEFIQITHERFSK